MNKTWTFLAKNVRSRLVIAVGLYLSLALASALVPAQAAPQVLFDDGVGTVTVDYSPSITSSRILRTPVRHTGDSGGTITTGISPANAQTEIIATPVDHLGGGVVTTRTGPTPTTLTVNRRARVLAAPTGAPSFTVSASCAPDATGVMTITDNGGDMTVPFTWRLDLNGIAIAQNSFQINAGQSFTLSTSGLYGTLTLDVLDASNAVVATGSMFCQSPPPPVPPSFTVSASCAPDATGTMTITDNGGNMTVPFTWRLDLNGVPVAQNSFQLNAGQSFTLSTSGLYGTLTLDVLDASNTVVATGSMFCQSPPPPVPPSFTVSANCTPDATGVMTISDDGGNMTVPFTWRLDLNGVPIAQNGFQINAGQSVTISTSGLYGTLTLNVLDTANTVLAWGSMFCPSPTVAVPNVVTLTQAAATSAITGAGLVVGTVTTANSSTVPAGSVTSQNPTAGTSVAPGSTVNLVVSTGPLLGDVNGDGVVNCADLAVVKASFGKKSGQAGFDSRADVNHDGVVNIVDLSTVAHAMPAGTVCK
jgi:hypothetical protein